MFLMAGLSAAAFAYVVNRYLVNRFGANTIVFITPILEEGLKTGLAVFLGAAILPVHVVFGLVEGIYDLKTSRVGIMAGLMSTIWHTVFGLLTVLVANLMGNLVYGLLAAIFVHYVGNSIVVKSKEERE